jgi:Arc/MetJ family transcription regulator
MRTTVNIADDVLQELMHLRGERTRTGAVNRALAEWVRWKRIEALKALRGKLKTNASIKRLREMELRELEVADE